MFGYSSWAPSFQTYAKCFLEPLGDARGVDHQREVQVLTLNPLPLSKRLFLDKPRP